MQAINKILLTSLVLALITGPVQVQAAAPVSAAPDISNPTFGSDYDSKNNYHPLLPNPTGAAAAASLTDVSDHSDSSEDEDESGTPASSFNLLESIKNFDPKSNKAVTALGSVGLICVYACIAHWAYGKGNPRFEKGFKKCTKKPHTEEGKDLHKAVSKGTGAIVGVLGSVLIIKALEKPLTHKIPWLTTFGFKGYPAEAA